MFCHIQNPEVHTVHIRISDSVEWIGNQIGRKPFMWATKWIVWILHSFIVCCQEPLWDLNLLSGLIPSKPSGRETDQRLGSGYQRRSARMIRQASWYWTSGRKETAGLILCWWSKRQFTTLYVVDDQVDGQHQGIRLSGTCRVSKKQTIAVGWLTEQIPPANRPRPQRLLRPQQFWFEFNRIRFRCQYDSDALILKRAHEPWHQSIRPSTIPRNLLTHSL